MFRSPNFESGYSLFELLLVCTLFGLLSQSALSTFPILMQGVHRNSARQEFESDLRRARSEALARGKRIILEISVGGNSYTIGEDAYPYSSDLTADDIFFTRTLPTGFTISSSDVIAFSADGYLIDDTGSLINLDVSIQDEGTTFLDADIYPTGGLSYS